LIASDKDICTTSPAIIAHARLPTMARTRGERQRRDRCEPLRTRPARRSRVGVGSYTG
jgi:hypothetical protein